VKSVPEVEAVEDGADAVEDGADAVEDGADAVEGPEEPDEQPPAMNSTTRPTVRRNLMQSVSQSLPITRPPPSWRYHVRLATGD
jgi:hypothetical protein